MKQAFRGASINSQLTVGQFNESFPPIMDGVAIITLSYAYWMNRKHGKAYVITPRVAGHTDALPFPVIRYASVPAPGRAPYRLGLPMLDRKLGRTLDRIPFDIVHAHCPFSSGRLALSLAHSRRIPIVATMHSKYWIDFRRALKCDWAADVLMRRVVRFYQSVDEVWVPNRVTRETLRSYGFGGEVKVQTNGTDLAPPSADEIGHLRREGRRLAGVPEEHDVVLYVGQQTREKNVDLVLSALAVLLRQGHRRLSGVFVGTGPDLDAFKTLAEQYGLDGRAVFTGAVRDRRHMRALYAMADLFVFPSTYDTDGIVLKEAAAFSLTAMVMAGQSTCEQVRDGENGVLCGKSEHSLAAQVRRLMEKPQLLCRIGLRARETLYRSLEDVADEVHARYQAIIEGR